MSEDKTTIQVVIDKQGRVEIHGWKDVEEARQLAKRLGVPAAFPVVRAEGLSPEEVDRISGRARILGYGVTVLEGGVEATAPAAATPAEPEAGTPERPHRRAAPWILVVPLVLVGLILLAVPIRDRMYRSYHPVPSMAAAIELARSSPPPASGMRALLDPDDSRYIALAVGEAATRVGDCLLDQGYCLRLHGVGAGSLDTLLGSGGGVLVFRIDLGRSSPDLLHVEEILRGQEKVANPAGTSPTAGMLLEVHPATVTQAPEGYPDGSGIVFDRKKSFQDLPRIRTGGRLERTERGLRLDAGAFKAALSWNLSPGLRTLLGPFWPEGDGANRPPADMHPVFYLDRVELYPWKTDDGPGPRQLYGEIGRFRLAGVAFGDVYVENDGAD